MRVARVRDAKPGGPFERSVAKLAKKYPHAHADIRDGLERLALSGWTVPAPPNVVAIPGVGRTMLKVRIPSTDMQRGTRGGFRVILDHCDGDEWRAVLGTRKRSARTWRVTRS